MRDIKFRAWHKEYKKMTQSFDLIENPRFEGSYIDVHDYGNCWGWEEWKYWHIEDCILMQSTGLKDKKRTEKYPEGQEIYEGDICKRTNHKGNVEIGIVKYSDGCWFPNREFKKQDTTYLECPTEYYNQCEVIGNIHENPELLEEGSND